LPNGNLLTFTMPACIHWMTISFAEQNAILNTPQSRPLQKTHKFYYDLLALHVKFYIL